MEKRNFLILGIVVVVVIAAVGYYNSTISGGIVRAPSSQCIDTDEGLDYYTKGEVTYMGEKYPDECATIVTLKEAWCEQSQDDLKYYPSVREYSCQDGCEDAACIYGEIEKSMP